MAKDVSFSVVIDRTAPGLKVCRPYGRFACWFGSDMAACRDLCVQLTRRTRSHPRPGVSVTDARLSMLLPRIALSESR